MGINYNPKIVKEGLVLCLDAANPRSYTSGSTTWSDLSGNGNNGTLINGPTFNTGSLGSIQFDGVNDYVNAPLTKTATCSFVVWAKTTMLVGRSPMLFNAGNTPGGPDLFFYDGKILWNTWDAGANPFADIPQSADDGKMHHYVVVNDASSNTKLYYDNNLIGTAIYKNASGTTSLTIGGATSQYMWNGEIATFKVYNRALTPAEIQQNFNATRSRFGI